MAWNWTNHKLSELLLNFDLWITISDPAFPKAGVPTAKLECQPNIVAKFPQKLHKNEKLWSQTPPWIVNEMMMTKLLDLCYKKNVKAKDIRNSSTHYIAVFFHFVHYNP